MKIICIEEHTIDAAMSKATRQAQATEAGYMADWGRSFEDKPSDSDERPHLLSIKRRFRLRAILVRGGSLKWIDVGSTCKSCHTAIRRN